jgi:hypothetical protein
MAQVIPPEILSVLALRPQFRAAGRRSALSSKALAIIDTIRADIPSGEDADGWSKVCRNWRTGGASSQTQSRSNSYNSSSGGNNNSSGPPSFRNSNPRGAWDMRKTLGTNNHATTSTVSTPPAGPAIPAQTSTGPTPAVRYVSMFKTSTEPVQATIVNTIILNKLNKFSPANYDEVKEFLMEILGSGERDFLTEFMQLVFRKAAAEETFCPLYAKLLKELSTGYPFLLDEMHSLYQRYTNIFQEVEEGECANMEEFIQKNKEKKYRQGYSQFLAELLKHGIVEHNAFVATIKLIIEQIDVLSKQEDKSNVLEEYSNCLLRIFRVLKGNAAICSAIHADIAKVAAEQLGPLTVRSQERPSLTNRIRFSILNAKECIDG